MPNETAETPNTVNMPVGLPIGRRGTTVVVYDGSVKTSKGGAVIFEKSEQTEVRRLSVSLDEFRAAAPQLLADDANCEAILAGALDNFIRYLTLEAGHDESELDALIEAIKNGTAQIQSAAGAAIRDYKAAFNALVELGVDPASLNVGALNGRPAVFTDLAPVNGDRHPSFNGIVEALRRGKKHGKAFSAILDRGKASSLPTIDF